MKLFLQSQGLDVWMDVENGYIGPTTTPVASETEWRLMECNAKAMHALLGGLIGSEFIKVMHCNSTKEIWDKLKNVYEGDGKVKGAKLQTYRRKFEHLTMKEEEDIATYFLRVDEILDTMRGLGEQVENTTLVQKILRSLPIIFDSKVASLEERKDPDKLSMDELHGILTSYEMRIEQENPSIKEEVLKVSKKRKRNNLKEKPYSSCSDNSDDENEANFIRKLKRGTGKFKGKLPFKCFKCGRIGHFASKCPYGEGSNNDEEEEEPPKNKKKN